MIRIFLLLILTWSCIFSEITQANQPTTSVNLSARDKYSVTDMHNRVRCQVDVPAANMPDVSWNDRLYTVAQNYANKCIFAHNPNRTKDYAAVGGTGYVGENLFVIWTSNQKMFVPMAINSFASEKVNFSYVNNCSSGLCGCKVDTVCGHYTQLIWADSNKVACAQSNCEGTPLGGKLIVCNYAPGGNLIGAPPYQSANQPVTSAACQAAEQVPLKFVAQLSASSQNTADRGVMNVLDDNIQTFWAPKTSDPQPYITMIYEQPLNISNLIIRWAGVNYSAKSVNIQYSTQADGSNLATLPVQVLAAQPTSIIKVNQSKIRFLKINFLERTSLNFRVATLQAIDPSFSMKWS